MMCVMWYFYSADRMVITSVAVLVLPSSSEELSPPPPPDYPLLVVAISTALTAGTVHSRCGCALVERDREGEVGPSPPVAR